MPPAASSSASRHAQTPTCVRTRVRSTADAHKLFYAVQRGILPLVRRRLDAEERLALAPGNVYIWEERPASADGPGPAMERFTEGKRWSQSRVREEFFFYHEKYQPPQDVVLSPSGEVQAPPDWQPLIKQTYSIITTTDSRQKLHLTTYFIQSSVEQLGTVDDIPSIKDLVVPPGTYVATREENKRQKRADTAKKRTKPSVATNTNYRAHSESVSPTATSAPPLPMQPPALPRTYASFQAYTSAHPMNDSRSPSALTLPMTQLPGQLSYEASSPTYQYPMASAYRPPDYPPPNMYHQPVLGIMPPPPINTRLPASTSAPMLPLSPTTWGAPPVVPSTSPVYSPSPVAARRGSIAPSETSSSSGSGSNTSIEAYRVYSPVMNPADAFSPAPVSANMYSSTFEYGYPTTPMPALPSRTPVTGAQSAMSGTQMGSVPGQGPGYGAHYNGEGYTAGKLVPIETLESPNPYRRDPADEGLLRQLTVKPAHC